MPPRRAGAVSPLAVRHAQRKVLELVAGGASANDAINAVGRKIHTYHAWRKHHPWFAEELRKIRDAQRANPPRRTPVPDFPEFSAEYLHQPLPLQHLRVWDVLNGRPPRDMHPTIRYHQGRPNYLLSNMPPEHAKTTVWTINYPVWRIAKDPDLQSVVISKSLNMAKRYLYAIKARLTGPQYRQMQVAFQPEGGWRDPDGSWTKTEIYVSGKGGEDKDPTVQALGWTGHIQGTRSQLIVADDMQDLKSAAQWPAMLDYISQDVDSRLSDDGIFLYNQTRVGADDVSKHLRDDLVDFDGTPVFTYLAQPAVLDYAENAQQWVTLWPGKWDGPKLAKKRAMARDERRWALVFQQADVSEDATFPPQALQCAINRRRAPGALTAEGWGTRAEGMTGLYVVGGLDPATVGHTAALVVGVDRKTRRRYLLDGFDKANCSPAELMDRVKELTDRLGVRTWVVERNAFQRFLTQLDEFRLWMYSRQVRLREHYTDDQNKFDDQFGVAAMAGLFLSCGRDRGDGSGQWDRTPDSALIELPTPHLSRTCSLLLEQLATWHPTEMRQRQTDDLVMALWFCEIEIRAYLGVGRPKAQFLSPMGATRDDVAGRKVINLNELAERRLAGEATG